jgi:hypothetical protein
MARTSIHEATLWNEVKRNNLAVHFTVENSVWMVTISSAVPIQVNKVQQIDRAYGSHENYLVAFYNALVQICPYLYSE